MNRAILLGAALMLATAGVCWQADMVGKPAPPIAAQDAKGKVVSLDSLTGKGPVFLYFIKEDCPVNAEAVKYYQRLADAYKGKATLVGVINADQAGYENWNRQHKTTFPVVLDPSKKVIRAYKAERSPWAVEIGKDKKIVKVWPGYSGNELTQIGAAMAKAGGVAVAKVDTAGAPGESQFG